MKKLIATLALMCVFSVVLAQLNREARVRRSKLPIVVLVDSNGVHHQRRLNSHLRVNIIVAAEKKYGFPILVVHQQLKGSAMPYHNMRIESDGTISVCSKVGDTDPIRLDSITMQFSYTP